MSARSPLSSLFAALFALIVFLGVTANPAAAAGGKYVIFGGTVGEQSQVRHALNASTFDWNVVPTQVTIHVVHNIPLSYSTPGQTWLDANLLDALDGPKVFRTLLARTIGAPDAIDARSLAGEKSQGGQAHLAKPAQTHGRKAAAPKPSQG